MTLNAKALEAAKAAFSRAENSPNLILCCSCDGKGYTHGFGEGGADPDWCESCGGGCVELAKGEEDRPIREAITTYLSSLPQAGVSERLAIARGHLSNIEAHGNAEANAVLVIRNVLSELEASLSSQQEEAVPVDAERIREVIAEESAGGAAVGWMSCTGCHETTEGAETGNYPYSKAFGCYVGAGCSECGGIGVVWEYWSKDTLDDMERDPTASPVPADAGEPGIKTAYERGRADAYDEAAALHEEDAQAYNHARDPGMANHERSYARKFRKRAEIIRSALLPATSKAKGSGDND